MAAEVAEEWPVILAEFTAAFELTRNAAREGESVVYVVRTDDLLGRRRPGPAMVATGLLSAARTAAIEWIKTGATINVVGFEPDTDPAEIADWSARLARRGGPTGELVNLGGLHLGRTRP